MPYIDKAYLEALKKQLEKHPDTNQDAYPEPMSASTSSLTESNRNCPQVSSFSDDEPWVAVYKKIQRLANVSERSTKGLRDRLTREGFDADAIEYALARACSFGIVDDMRYAEILVRSRLTAGKGRRGIEAELRELAIDPDTVEGWHDDADDKSELERAIDLLEKKPPRAKNKRDAAYRKLVTKGYSSSVAQSAARIWSESA
ncbi:MAG: regulatory protein RecX [Raoultibacter sp.]